ncbi:MAG: hypothetical protein ACFFDY_01100 [Candidatus Thorarchaeota archaeon]
MLQSEEIDTVQARKLAHDSEQDVIICENHGTIKVCTTEDYIKHFLAVYEIKATITPTGQIVMNKRFN